MAIGASIPFMTGWVVGNTKHPEPQRSQLNDAIFSTVRGGFRIIGGMVQMAAGITRLVAATAIKAAEVVEGAVEATGSEDEEPEPEPKPR